MSGNPESVGAAMSTDVFDNVILEPFPVPSLLEMVAIMLCRSR
jgi:hypothetical protein